MSKYDYCQSLYGRGQALDPVGGGKGNGDKDVICDTLSKMADYERKVNEIIDKLINKFIDKFVNTRLQIEKSIQDVADDVQREVLERRYLLYQDLESDFSIKRQVNILKASLIK